MTVYNDYAIDFGKIRKKGAAGEESDILLAVPSRNALVWLVSSTDERGPILSGYASIGESVRRVTLPGTSDPGEMHRKAVILASALTGLPVYDDRPNGDGPTKQSKDVLANIMSGSAVTRQLPGIRTPEVMGPPEMRLMRRNETDLTCRAGIAETGVNVATDGFTTVKVAKVLHARKERAGFALPGPSRPPLNEEAATKALASVHAPSVHEVRWFGHIDDQPPKNVVERDGRMIETMPDGEERGWEPVSKRRLNAASGMPLLAGVIASEPDISKAVDENGPVFGLIREATGLSKGNLKSLKAVTNSGAPIIVTSGPDFGGEISFGLRDALREIAALPPEWCPGNDKEWEDFRVVMASVIIPLRNTLGIEPEPLLRGQLKKMNGWAGMRRMIGNAMGISEPMDVAALSDMTRGVIEAVHLAGNDVLMPMIFEAARARGNTAMPDENGIARIREAALAMCLAMSPQKGSPYARLFSVHRSLTPRKHLLAGARIMDDGEEEFVDNDFPLVRGAGVIFTASNGVKFRQIENFADMNDHGDMQSNCLNYGFTKMAAETMRNAFFEVSDPYFSHKTMRQPNHPSDVSTLRFYISRNIAEDRIMGRKYFAEGDRGVVGYSEFRTASENHGGGIRHQPNPKQEHILAATEFLQTFGPAEVDRLLERQIEQDALVRARGSVIGDRDVAGGDNAARANRSAQTWGAISGVSMNGAAIDAVWGEWAGHVLSGADPNDRRCLRAVPEIAKLMEDLGLEIPGPREREEGFDPQP